MTRGVVLRVLAVVGLLAVELLAVMPAPPAGAATHAITMANYAFSPANETIIQGDSVTWTNTDQAPHDVTVTSGPVAIHSPTITTGQSWTYTFTAPGTYSYICSIHPDMRATLVVAAATAPTTRVIAPPPATTRMAVVPTTRMVMPEHAPTPVATTPATTAAIAAPAGQHPAAAVTATQATQQPGLNPLLLVAGLVAAVATLCLLLLGSRQE